MLRTASRSNPRCALSNRTITSHAEAHFIVASSSRPRVSISTTTSRIARRRPDSLRAFEEYVRAYASTSAGPSKDVKHLSENDAGDALPRSNASVSPHNMRKSLDPSLVPRKVDQANSRDTIISPSKPTLHPGAPSSSSFSSKKPTGKRREEEGPVLVKPATVHNVGIIKTALNDIDDALTNGTLKPLPPDLIKAQEESRRKREEQAAAAAKDPSSSKPSTVSTFGGVELTPETGRIWWHKLKEMTKFYFFGVTKLGREHRVLAMQISKRLRAAKGTKDVQSWRDNEFLSTYKRDLLRLVPFVSIILILEEVLPLIIIYAPFLLPSTCKLPAQAKRIDDLADQKRWDSLLALGGILKLRDGLDGARAGGTVLGHEAGMEGGRLDRLPQESLPLLCRLLGVAPYGPSPYLKFRLRTTLATLALEDRYFSGSKPESSDAESPITSAMSVDRLSQLTMSELRTILGRRGFPNTSLTLPQLRHNLNWWLTRSEHPVDRRLEAVLELARVSQMETAMPPRRS